MMQTNKVLIIEDSHLMRLQVKNILEKANFAVIELADANELFSSRCPCQNVGVILLDINLPGMDGLSALKAMKETPSITWPPVIVLSSFSDKSTIKTALMLGAKDYILKPLNADLLLRKVEHIVNQPIALTFRQRYLNLVQTVKETYESYAASDWVQFPRDIVAAWLDECEKIVHHDGVMILFHEDFSKTDYSFRHAINVAILSGLIASWMNLKEQEMQELIIAGLLHDLGKARMPPNLLCKSRKLSRFEMEIVKSHPAESYTMIKDEDFSPNILLGVSQHHERMDGSGYPNGLLGKDISLAAKIVAIADIYDAMTSNKVYRQAETPFSVIDELFREMFGKLDPHICSVFLKNVKKFMIGKRVRLSDGSEARVKQIAGGGFGNPLLEDVKGKLIELTEGLHVVEMIEK